MEAAAVYARDPLRDLLTSIEGCSVEIHRPPEDTLAGVLRECGFICHVGGRDCTVKRLPTREGYYYEVRVGDDVCYPTTDDALKSFVKGLKI